MQRAKSFAALYGRIGGKRLRASASFVKVHECVQPRIQDFGALEVMFHDSRWRKLLGADFFYDFCERQIMNGSHIGQSSVRADCRSVKRAILAKL